MADEIDQSPNLPKQRWRYAVMAGLCALIGMAPAQRAAADAVTVFAAASLNKALSQIAAQWQDATGHIVRFSFAGSSALARQIQAGAPADLFIPASTDWMDAVEASGDILSNTRRDIVGNTLVLIAQAENAPAASLDQETDLHAIIGAGTLAMALVDAVPAGIYGQQALKYLGQWEAVAGQIVQADSVSGALNFVLRGEADFGIVYATDARGVLGVHVMGTFAQGSHDPIRYPAALTTRSSTPAAQMFLDYLTSGAARAIWQEAGFQVLP